MTCGEPAGWEVAMVTELLCFIARLGRWGPMLTWSFVCVCVVPRTQGVQLSGKMKCVHFKCASPITDRVILHHQGCCIYFFTSAAFIFHLRALSPRLLTRSQPLPHFLHKNWQQGWSAIKWCFIKLDEADVGVFGWFTNPGIKQILMQ